jgi:FYVE/RhoGEF/PH domain-containing protein 5/6
LKERNDWLEAINCGVEKWRERKATFRSADPQQLPLDGGKIGDQAPVNVPDERVTMCQGCSAEFTLTYRRHHCRGCGEKKFLFKNFIFF